MSWTHRGHRVKEKTVDPARPPLRGEARARLLTLSPTGPWFYVILVLVQVGVVAVVTRGLGIPLDLTLATLFASEGIVSMVVAWFLAGAEGSIRGHLFSKYAQLPVEGGTDVPPYVVEAKHDADVGAANAPLVLEFLIYGGALLVIAFFLAL